MHMVHYPGLPGSRSMPPRRLTHPQIADDLIARIEAGEYKVGSKLPTYAEMADIYSVSIATIQRAISMLRATGHVEGIAGVGVYVRRR